jgi:hypothetical protein
MAFVLFAYLIHTFVKGLKEVNVKGFSTGGPRVCNYAAQLIIII